MTFEPHLNSIRFFSMPLLRLDDLPIPDYSKAAFIAFLSAYYSSDTFPLRPQEMSVDCFIIAFFVHIVPFPDNPACSK